MIYVCIPAHNEARTLGLVLWKLRKVFADFPREYHLLVSDDASTDETRERLEPYTQALPLTVVTNETRQGYAATLEALLRRTTRMTDRPKRDCAITMHADFTHDPQFVIEFVKLLESGSDVVVGEDLGGGHLASWSDRVVRWSAPRLLASRFPVPDVKDVVSGFCAFRLFTLRAAFHDTPGGRLLQTEGRSANAELLSHASKVARRVDTLPVPTRYDLRQRQPRHALWGEMRAMLRARATTPRRSAA